MSGTIIQYSRQLRNHDIRWLSILAGILEEESGDTPDPDKGLPPSALLLSPEGYRPTRSKIEGEMTEFISALHIAEM